MAHDPLYRLSDLESWTCPGTSLAVLGHPVAHSLSPAMHNAALAVMAQTDRRFRDWRYHKFEVPPEQLPEALPRFHACGFQGLNLTIPHKVQAVDLIARVDPAARPLGAVNTLTRSAEGWHGSNTDGYGVAQAVRQELGLDLAGTEVVQLGAGGAARAVAAQCLLAGCRRLWIGNRDQARLADLLARLREIEPDPERLRGFDLADPPTHWPESGLIINVTSLGLRPDDPAPIDPARFGPAWAVYDSTYGSSPSALLRAARARRQRAADGLSMLVWQGVRSLETWTGAPVPAEVMRAAAEAALLVRA